jgi:hypothetical protein
MSKIITKALAVVLAAGAITTVAATGASAHGWHGGWSFGINVNTGYAHERVYEYDRGYRYDRDYDRGFHIRLRFR